MSSASVQYAHDRQIPQNPSVSPRTSVASLASCGEGGMPAFLQWPGTSSRGNATSLSGRAGDRVVSRLSPLLVQAAAVSVKSYPPWPDPLPLIRVSCSAVSHATLRVPSPDFVLPWYSTPVAKSSVTSCMAKLRAGDVCMARLAAGGRVRLEVITWEAWCRQQRVMLWPSKCINGLLDTSLMEFAFSDNR